MTAVFKLGDEWEVGDECVVGEGDRVWKIIGFLGKGTGSRRIADLAAVGFKFEGLHSTYVSNLRPVPTTEASR